MTVHDPMVTTGLFGGDIGVDELPLFGYLHDTGSGLQFRVLHTGDVVGTPGAGLAK